MAIKTNSVLRTEAQAIRDEIVTGANSATKIGTFLDDFLESQDSMNGHMWQHYKDNTYLLGSKLAIAAGVRTKMTIDGVQRTEVSPNGYAAIWDVSTNKIVPFALNDFYTVRIDIQGWSDLAVNNFFDIEMDIGGGIGVVAADTGVFIKGATTQQQFNFSSQFFVGSTFLANGAEIYITPESDASFWEIGITISRVYKAVV